MHPPKRVITYIDGFNLYFGLKEKFPQYKWLDVVKLSNRLVKKGQVLIEVKYFTSRVSNHPEKEKRQSTYIDALSTHTEATIIYGHYKSRPKSCLRCGHTWNSSEEKMTDVNIAVQLLVDAMQDRFDIAILISGDSDLVPPIKAVHSQFKNKKVVVAFPPNRFNNSIKNEGRGVIYLGRTMFSKSQLPQYIRLENGFVLERPKEWQ